MKKILLCYFFFVGFSNNSKAQEQPTSDLIHLSKQIDTIAKKYYLNKGKAEYYIDSIVPMLNKLSFLGIKPDVPGTDFGGFVFSFDEEKNPKIYSIVKKEIETLIEKEGLLFDYEKTKIIGFKKYKVYKLKNKAKATFLLDRDFYLDKKAFTIRSNFFQLICYFDYYFYM